MMKKETDRLRDFWNGRYNEFSLQESGIKGLDDDYIELLYRCKFEAYMKALSLIRKDYQEINIMDIGCGQGFFGNVAKELSVNSYFGIDISNKVIDFLSTKYPEFSWINSDFCSDHFNKVIDMSYDIVQSIEVIHLVMEDDYLFRGLKNIANKVKQGGHLILTDVLPSKEFKVNDYITFRPISYYRKFALKNNLKLIQIIPMYYWIPSRGIQKFPINYLFKLMSSKTIFKLDRALLKYRVPPFLQSHDSAMKMMVFKKNI